MTALRGACFAFSQTVSRRHTCTLNSSRPASSRSSPPTSSKARNRPSSVALTMACASRPGLDARRLPQDPGAPDLAACAFRNRGHAARRQLDHPRALAQAQGHPAGQGPGRGRPRPVPVQRRRDAGRVARRPDRRSAQRPRQVLQHLQLPHAQLGRHWHDRLAGRRLGHHQPDPAVPLFLRPLCARHGARLWKSPSTSARATTC